jgi:hypothetical protein
VGVCVVLRAVLMLENIVRLDCYTAQFPARVYIRANDISICNCRCDVIFFPSGIMIGLPIPEQGIDIELSKEKVNRLDFKELGTLWLQCCI